MSKQKRVDKKIQKSIAKRRIDKLFSMAEENALNNKINLANRYVQIARKISMKYLVPIPPKYKRRFCKHCYHYLLPNITSRIRIHRGKIVIFCFNCKKYERFPLKNFKK